MTYFDNRFCSTKLDKRFTSVITKEYNFYRKDTENYKFKFKFILVISLTCTIYYKKSADKIVHFRAMYIPRQKRNNFQTNAVT